MARMDSPAGEMEVHMVEAGVAKKEFFIGGQIGVWDARIFFSPDEVVDLISLMLSWKTIGYVLRALFSRWGRAISRPFRRSRATQAAG